MARVYSKSSQVKRVRIETKVVKARPQSVRGARSALRWANRRQKARGLKRAFRY